MPTAGIVDPPAAIAALAARLRHAGVPVGVDRSASLLRAVELVRPSSTTELHRLARITLLTDVSQFAAFERVVSGQSTDDDIPPVLDQQPGDDQGTGSPLRSPAATSRMEEPPITSPVGATAEPVGQVRAEVDGDTPVVLMSRKERLRHADLDQLSDAELVELRLLLREVRLQPPLRRSRRSRGSRAVGRIDLRATMRQLHRTGGEPIRPLRRRRVDRPRRVVVLCDVSGSMAPYSRAYIQLLHAQVGALQRSWIETFVFATRLTRVTTQLSRRDPDAAIAASVTAAPDWWGGTRISDAIGAFMDRYGRRGMARGAVIVIISDGWERGDARALGEHLHRLRRVAHRVVWVNPRVAAAGYEPLVGGMVAALPYIDVLLSGHSLAALRAVVDAIAE